jgi:hypothetical protein
VAPKEVGYLSPDRMRRVWEATLKVEREQGPSRGEFIQTVPKPIYFRNDSGETIPPYSFMQVIDTLDIENEPNYILVDKPIDLTRVQCPLLINGPNEIEKDKHGVAQFGPIFRLKTNGGSYAPGDRLGPLTSSWQATFGAMYRVLGDDDIEANIVRVMFDTSTMYGKTKSAGLVSGASGFVYGYKADGTLTSKEYPAKTKGSDIDGDTDVIMHSTEGLWSVWEYC